MKKILVTGATGLVGKYLRKIMPDANYVSSKDYNLLIQNDVKILKLDMSGIKVPFPIPNFLV